jgi:hypothetical protein
MACKDMNGVINDRTVYVRQWPASVALENLSEALGLLGPHLTFFIDGSYQFGDTLKVLHSCDHRKLVELMKKFVVAARVDGREIKPETFNAEYNGELHRVFDTFAFVCEVNYRDFFEQGAPPQPQDHAEDEESDQQQEDPLLTNMTP